MYATLGIIVCNVFSFSMEAHLALNIDALNWNPSYCCNNAEDVPFHTGLFFGISEAVFLQAVTFQELNPLNKLYHYI